MNIKCKCGNTVLLKNDNINIVTYKNPISLEYEALMTVYYQTFCEKCGDYITGVKRKILTYDDIIKIMEDKRYGV